MRTALLHAPSFHAHQVAQLGEVASVSMGTSPSYFIDIEL